MDLKTLNHTFALCETLRASVNFSRKRVETASLDEGERNTFLQGAMNNEIEANLKLAENELNALVALDLFAVFERELRDAAQNAVTSHIPTPNPVFIRLAELTAGSVERWNITDIMDTLQGIVDANIRGQVKQLYSYQNWIAHGKNPQKMPSVIMSPKDIFYTLTEFINQAAKVL
jgi:hypothetical protein